MSRAGLLLPVLAALVACGGDGPPPEPDAAPPREWSRMFGEPGTDHASGLARAENGDLILAGRIGGAVDFGGGPVTPVAIPDAFIARFTPAGEHLWSRRLVQTAPDSYVIGPPLVAASSGGDLAVAANVVGTVNLGGVPLGSPGTMCIVIVLLDADSRHVSSRQVACMAQGSQLFVTHIVVDEIGRIVLAGIWHGTTNFGDGPISSRTPGFGRDSFVVAYDSTAGPPLWFHQLSVAPADFDTTIGAMAIDGTEVVAAGTFYATLDVGGGPLTTSAGQATFVARWRVDTGPHVRSFATGDGGSVVSALAVGPDGVLLGGGLGGSADFGGQVLTPGPDGNAFLVSLSPTGAPAWTQLLGSDGVPTAIGVAPDGAVTVAGGDTDIYWASFDSTGGPLAAHTYGGAGTDSLAGFALSDDPTLLSVAGTSPQIDLGQGTLTSAGDDDIFLASVSR